MQGSTTPNRQGGAPQENRPQGRPPMGFGGPGRGPMHGVGMTFEKPKDSKKTLKRLLNYLSNNIKTLVAAMFFCIASALVTIFATRISGTIIDNFVETGDVRGLLWVCCLLLGIYAFGAASHYVQERMMVRVSQTTTATIRRDLFAKISSLPLNYYDTHQSGDIMSRLTNDVDTIGTTMSQGVTQLFAGVISLIGTLVAMIILSPLLTLVTISVVPLMIFITRTVSKISRKYFKEQSANLGELNGYVEEIVSGGKVVKLFSREQTAKAEFAKINQKLKASGFRAQAVSGVMGPMMNMINNISYLLVAVAGGYMVVGGSVTVGDVFAFLQYKRQFSQPINQIATLFNTIQSALAAAERIFEVMDEKPEEDAPDAIELSSVNGEIEFDDVTFSYIKDTPVLKNANIKAAKSQQIAIVGPTGAGKTTIISLLTRFYDVDSGAIRIDGIDIRKIKRDSLRRMVGMVLQDTYLFSETVKENIRYGAPDATDEEIINAAKMANAHQFIVHLPQGYDTVLADNGQNLSQGQRQLLAIARAILANPQILILDEATSSVDTRTELKIQEAMLTLMKGRTSFIIAHRLSTIKNADNILVINSGEVVESGVHSDLLSLNNGFYANLYNVQYSASF